MLDLVHRNDLPPVLLIDDDMVSREVVATILTMGGYPVHTAVDGDSALKMMADGECEPGVILMDAQMPGLSGTALIKQLRAASKATVVAISASAPPKDVVAAADGLLLKPFSPEDLNALLEKRASGKAGGKAAHKTRPAEPVVNQETLAQLREMMPDSAVKQIYGQSLPILTGGLPRFRRRCKTTTRPRYGGWAMPSRVAAQWQAPCRLLAWDR